MKKIISWNVNGIRAIIKKGFLNVLAKEQPEIFALQEVKASLEQVTRVASPSDYNFVIFAGDKPGYSGVATYIKKGIKYDVKKGLGIKEFDQEGRSISIEMEDMVFVTAYFPNSQPEAKRLKYKLAFCDAMKDYLDGLNKKGKSILLSGDYNIAHTEIDLAHPKENEDSPGYFPEERAWMHKFLAKDYVDTFRMFTPGPEHYTWWSYRTNARARNVGWRIDYHCVNQHLKDRVVKSYHNPEIMGSDHCPVTILLK
ncbi:MAG: exodeoxyribonuclease III [bacterium]